MQPSQELLNRAPVTKNSLPAGVNASRRKPAAEEEFLERHPWANAQPYRPNSPLSTPVLQRRTVEVHLPQDSTSAIYKAHSGPNSSAIQSPPIREQIPRNVEPSRDLTSDQPRSITPTKAVAALTEASTANSNMQESIAVDKAKPSQLGARVQSRPSSVPRNPLQKNHSIADGVLSSPRVIDPADKPMGTNALSSSAIRYPVVKVEEALHSSRQIPTIQYHHPPVPT